MNVGYIRLDKKPNKMVKMLAKNCGYYDIQLVYFRPEDINYENQTINGRVLENDKWIEKEVGIPPYIDICPPVFRKKKTVQFLKKYSTLSMEKRVGSKEKINNMIVRDGTFKHLIIPYIMSGYFKDFIKFLKRHSKVILKPKGGIQGKSIYQVSKEKRGYLVTYQNEEIKMSKRQLKKFIKDQIKPGKYLVQKYIHSRTANGDPFDCRVRLEKNRKGKWEVAIYLVRIGANQKVVSNVAQGGSVIRLSSFLKFQFPDLKDDIRRDLKRYAKEIPPKIEELSGQSLIAMGLDFGIEPDGSLYLFEVETNPGRTFGEGQVALLKSEYYNYVKQQLISEQTGA